MKAPSSPTARSAYLLDNRITADGEVISINNTRFQGQLLSFDINGFACGAAGYPACPRTGPVVTTSAGTMRALWRLAGPSRGFFVSNP